MKVALVHDWLIHMRGGEKVLEAIAELYPDATIYTLFYRREELSPVLAGMKIKASFLQRVPGIFRIYRWLLPLFPLAVALFKLREDLDLVISISHCAAKAVHVPRGALHVCYCNTPMRYAWGFEQDYFGKFAVWVRPFLRLTMAAFRRWDRISSRGVDHFIANSKNVQQRIQKYYGREAVVLHPPLNQEAFAPDGDLQNYYLVVSAFVPYKRVDIVIEAFNTMDQELRIVGHGPLERYYRTLVRRNHISFLGAVTPARLRKLYSGARALIFPTDEDFGIVPLEAQASGTPVIALGRGGALESVRHGIFFDAQTPEAVREAVARFESMSWDRARIPESVASFAKENFQTAFKSILASWAGERLSHAAC